MTPMCTFVPRQLNKDQMTSLFPKSWITKYEMLHQATKPIQSNDPLFIRKANGEVETRFLIAPSEKKDVTIFPTQIAMLQPMSYVCEDGLKIKAFRKMENLFMKENRLLVIYGGIFVIMLIAKRKRLLKKIIPEERKNPLSRLLKKDMKQEIQKLTSLENPLESLTIMFSILEPVSKPFIVSLHAKKTMIKTRNLH